jgi:hypothetical protein
MGSVRDERIGLLLIPGLQDGDEIQPVDTSADNES